MYDTHTRTQTKSNKFLSIIKFSSIRVFIIYFIVYVIKVSKIAIIFFKLLCPE